MSVFQPMSFTTKQSIITDGLVFSVDAGNQNSYIGSGTTWTDISGNGVDMELINGPTFVNERGGIIRFDGTNDFSNPIASGYPANIPKGREARTICAYVNVKRNNSQLFGMGGNSGNGSRWVLNIDTNSPSPRLTVEGLNCLWATTDWAGLNNWQYICATLPISSSMNASKIYVNGTERAGTAPVGGTVAINTLSGGKTNFQISGVPSLGATSPADADYSMLHVYNRVLSATEIAANFDVVRGRFGV